MPSKRLGSFQLSLLLFLSEFFFEFCFTSAQWSGSEPEICVVPSTFEVRPHSTCSDVPTSLTGGCAAPIASISAQRGETEDIQLLLRKGSDIDDPKGGVQNVSIMLEHLPLEDGKSVEAMVTASVYRVGYVYAAHTPRYPGSGGGWRPDPLLPLKAEQTFSVPSGVAQAIWISFRVSKDAAPGNYTNASVVLTYEYASSGLSDTKANGIITVPLSIEVFDLTLPSMSETRLGSAWSGSWTSSAFAPYLPGGASSWDEKTKEKWFDMMIDHRMPPDSIYLTKQRSLADYVYMASKGVKWFSILDVSKLSLNDIQEIKRPHFGGVTGTCRNFTDAYVEHMIATLKPIVQGLESKGLLDRAYVYGFDENPASCEPQVRKLFGATKKAFPSLKTAAVLNWSPMPVDLPVDIWILQYEEFDAENAMAWIDAGKVQWHYHCIEPHQINNLNTFIERPTFQSRLLFWLAALRQLKNGAPSGWLYYAVNLWRPCDNPLCTSNVTNRKPLVQNYSSPYVDFPVANYIWQPKINDIFANGDGQFLYPCEGGMPCGSTRLASLRDGLEDWDGILSVATATKAIPLIEEFVRGPADWDWLGYRRLQEIRQQLARGSYNSKTNERPH